MATDEYCVCRVESTSIDDVRRACESAGIPSARIVGAQELHT
jgi:hypothetical protein